MLKLYKIMISIVSIVFKISSCAGMIYIYIYIIHQRLKYMDNMAIFGDFFPSSSSIPGDAKRVPDERI